MRHLALILSVLPVCLLAQAQPVPVTDAIPGWKWTMDSITKTVDAVRAGRDLTPSRWPDGKKVAVLLSFDVDNETVTLRYGETSVGALSMGQYGARVGLGRVLDLLDARRIPASFFIPSVSLALHPEMGPRIARSGRHEFAVHGWIHEMNATLPDSVERALLQGGRRSHADDGAAARGLPRALVELLAEHAHHPAGHGVPVRELVDGR